MSSCDISDRLFVSTMADERGAAIARTYGLGLEEADFCYAPDMDDLPHTLPPVREAMRGVERFTFHMPYSELTPAAVDPLVLDVTRRRYQQAFELAYGLLGIKRIIVHSGYTPRVYFKEWFVPRSVEFWKSFLSDKPSDVLFCLENVMEDEPQLDYDVVDGVGDSRLRLCLDVGHANSLVSNVPWQTWLEADAPLLAHFHLHNNNGDQDLHNPLGDGALPMRDLLLRAIELCPEATFTMELRQPQSSIDWLIENGFLSR
jgi:sugar phosphate isomerase/epimerase